MQGMTRECGVYEKRKRWECERGRYREALGWFQQCVPTWPAVSGGRAFPSVCLAPHQDDDEADAKREEYTEHIDEHRDVVRPILLASRFVFLRGGWFSVFHGDSVSG